MSKLNKQAFQQLVDEDMEWLLEQPRTLERDHIAQILKDAVEMYYPTPKGCSLCGYYHPGGSCLDS